ncbi:MAG TPA: type ISP restriction/modification enzyme [bacterium]|nr:type ISP restriction/modification enzyme [bacterium]
MADAAAIAKFGKAVKSYARDISALFAAGSTTEATYYPAVKSLLGAALEVENLPFDVRINTSEQKIDGGVNLPDVALYDGSGEFLVVSGEVKLPDTDLQHLAVSTENQNQIGRYLAATRAVVICNLRSFGLVTVAPEWKGSGPVPPDGRRLEQVVEFWSSVTALSQGKPIEPASLDSLIDLVETAVTRYAPIAEPQSLARIMARQARRAKADLPDKFTSAVRDLLDDFGKALGVTFVGPEGEEFFRSSLIQTAFYGLFAGWALWSQGKRTTPFKWEDLADYLKIPFLGSLFHEFRHPSRIKELRLAKHLDIATETLARVDHELFFKRFRLPTLKHEEQPAATAITYFYEPFLEAFDPDLRKELGVWYTPTSIIRYQVGKIDRILREKLGCTRGFADDRVVVLDPACGTGAYLVEVLRYTAEQLERDGAGATIPARLLDAVCRRFIGFEILTAPFVVAQLQLYLLLARLGSAPDETHRPAVFLTNALTGWHGPDQLKLNFPELQDEHDAASHVKRDAKIIVVLGNPPYNRFAGVPLEEEADLVDYYKGITRNNAGKQIGQTLLYSRWGVRKHLLDDLYIRFFRLADIRIGENAEFGIVSFISNSSYLVGRSHPIMRESLLSHFNAIWIDNLHGNRRASERTPWGDSCETIFSTDEVGPGIKVGTCVSTVLKCSNEHTERARVFIRDFWGRAAKKREALLASLDMELWPAAQQGAAAKKPEGPRPYVEFAPSESTGWKFAPRSQAGFEDWPSLEDLFPRWFQGVNPNRGLDGSVIDADPSALAERMLDYFSDLSFDELQKRYPALCEERADYDPKQTRERLRKTVGFQKQRIVPYVLFPFDARWIYYETEAKLLNRPRPELGDSLGGNEFLVAAPQPRRVSESRPLILRSLFDLHLHDWGSVGFPAEIRSNEEVGELFKPDAQTLGPVANMAESVWTALRARWKLKGDLKGWNAKTLCRALFRYCCAIAHSPQYETDNKDSLSQGWPRIPISKNQAEFDHVVSLGDHLAILLDPLSEAATAITALIGKEAKTFGVVRRIGGGVVKQAELLVEYSYYGAATGRWDERPPTDSEPLRAEWGTTTGDLYLNESVYLANVPREVWRYELGGYPVLKKWLGYRQANRRNNSALSLRELDEFRGIVLRIAALLCLRPALDAAYERVAADAWLLEDFQLAGDEPEQLPAKA